MENVQNAKHIIMQEMRRQIVENKKDGEKKRGI
jgi:hypothetical protein